MIGRSISRNRGLIKIESGWARDSLNEGHRSTKWTVRASRIRVDFDLYFARLESAEIDRNTIKVVSIASVDDYRSEARAPAGGDVTLPCDKVGPYLASVPRADTICQ